MKILKAKTKNERKVKRMFPNLRAEITRRNLTMEKVAEAIGVSTTHFSLKMNGKYTFTLKEAIAIKKLLKTEMALEELFLERLDGDE